MKLNGANNLINKINLKKTAKALSWFKNPANIVPIATIEGAVIVGRSYRGFKRGGKDELRERIFEETACGLFWLFGADLLRRGINKVGEKVLGNKIGNLNVDIGYDELRNPFGTISKSLQKTTGIFKVASTIGAVLATTTFVGFGLPKIKQKISNMARKKNCKNDTQTTQASKNNSLDNNKAISDKINADDGIKQAEKNISFKGDVLSKMLLLTHNIDNNSAVRLLSTDAGILTGRALSARNPDEAREYLFRDTTSSYFYTFATGNIIMLLNALTKNKNIHPNELVEMCEELKKKMPENMSLEDFAKATFKKDDIGKKLANITFDKKNVVELEKLKDVLTPEEFAKATQLSKLQPQRDGKSLLTKLQVEDIFSSSWFSDPEFLSRATKSATWGKSENPEKFISRKQTDKARTILDSFTESVYNSIKKKKDTISYQDIENYAKKNIIKSSAFFAIGTAISIFALAWVIPKMQTELTKRRTGRDENPAFAEMNKTAKA